MVIFNNLFFLRSLFDWISTVVFKLTYLSSVIKQFSSLSTPWTWRIANLVTLAVQPLDQTWSSCDLTGIMIDRHFQALKLINQLEEDRCPFLTETKAQPSLCGRSLCRLRASDFFHLVRSCHSCPGCPPGNPRQRHSPLTIAHESPYLPTAKVFSRPQRLCRSVFISILFSLSNFDS